MIIAILLSYLQRIGQRQHFRDVYWGVAAALVLVLGGGVAAFFLIKQYEGSNVQTYFETATYVLAAVVLTYMTFWMQRHAKGLAKELERRSDLALSRGTRWGLGLLAFQAVGREGLETMVFTLAIVFASSKQAATPIHGNLLLLGAGLGVAVALVIAFAIYKLGADAVENLQQLRWLPFGQHVLWNSSAVVSEASSFGDVLHSLLGYADHPTLLQVIVWLAYVVTSTAFFMRIGRKNGVRPTFGISTPAAPRTSSVTRASSSREA